MNIPFTRHALDNGLSVIVHEDHNCPIVAVNVWYHVGSKNEVPGRTGFAHLFEHLMFEGSAHHDKGYFHPLQEAGALLNGSTNADRTNYWEVVPTSAFELALWMESDRMAHLLPALTPAKFDNQREVVLNERRQNYENRPVRARDDGDGGGAVPAGPSVSLAHDRLGRRPAGEHPRRGARVLRDATTTRQRVAGDRRRRQRRGGARSRRRVLRRRARRAQASAPCDARRSSQDRCACCTKIASSCRACIWRGTRRRCSRRVTPNWI